MDHCGIPGHDATKQHVINIEQTLSIIKPDAVESHHIGEIIARFEKEGMRIAAIKMIQLNKQQAEGFYAVHKDRPFYGELVKFMISGPVVAIVLEGPDAVAKNRALMGSTDPNKAEPGTLRASFAKSVQCNAVHGSDSPASAHLEILQLFKPEEIQK
jgi:nucleoside-diphosphate kinase